MNVLQHARLAISAVALLALALPGAAGAQLCGDADGDDVLTDTDAVLALRAAASLSSSCTVAICDLDGSGAPTDLDGLNILRLAAGVSAETSCPTGIAGFVGGVTDDDGTPGLLRIGAAPIPSGGAPDTISSVSGDGTVTAGETAEVTVTYAAGASAAATADPGLLLSLRDASGVRVDGFFEIALSAATGTSTLSIALAETLGGGTFFLDVATFAAGVQGQYKSIAQTPTAPVITQIINAAGDGVNTLGHPDAITIDNAGTAYVLGENSCNVFRITSGGSITEVMNATDTGDPNDPCVDHLVASPTTGDVFVGAPSGVFRIPPDGGSQIYDTNLDFRLDSVFSVDIDDDENVFATGVSPSSSVVCLANGGQGGISTAINLGGDGVNALAFPGHLSIGGNGVLFVSGEDSKNVFRVVNPCAAQPQATQIFTTALSIDDLGADPAGNAYVTFNNVDSIVQISPSGDVTELLDGRGDSALVDDPDEIATDAAGNVYVVGEDSNNAFRITSPGTPKQTIQQILDNTGDGTNPLLKPENIAVNDAGTTVYVSGADSNNAFKIVLP